MSRFTSRLTLLFCSVVVMTVAADQARWPDERQAGPFICHADHSLAPHAALLAELGDLQHQLSAALAVEPPREMIHMFLFAERSTYEQYIRHYFPEVPQRRALFIKRQGPGMVFAYESSELDIDVRHEGTHALLHSVLPMVPLWLDEGLAEYFEVSPEQRELGHEHMRSIQWRVRLGLVPRMEDLEELGELTDMTAAHYQRAWAWVHFMLHGPEEARDELQRFLGDISARTPPGKLSQRLRRRIPDLDRAFRDHFK